MNQKKLDQAPPSEILNLSIRESSLIWRLLGYLKPYRKLLVITVCFLLFSKMIEVIVPIIIGNLTQKILAHHQLDPQETQILISSIVKTGFFLLILLFMSYLSDSVNFILRSWIGQHGLYHFRIEIYKHVLNMPIAYFNRTTVGSLMTRTIHDVDQINQMFTESLIPIIGNIFLFIGIYTAIFFIDWRIALLVLAILPLVWWLTSHFRYHQYVCYTTIRTLIGSLNTFIQEHLMGASIIRNFGMQSIAKNQFNKINEDYCLAYQESIHYFAFFIAGIDFIQNLSLILAFVLIVVFTPLGISFEIGTFFTFSLYCLMFFRPLADLAERYNVLQMARAASERIFNLLDESSEKLKDTGTLILKEIETIKFDDVWFNYEKDQWILKGLSLTINKGKTYAIVGMTGEGKSTIISLFMRFYEPQKGKILINNLPIQDYTLTSLRNQFSLVLQDPVIFSGTVAENISLFDQSFEREKIEKVIDYLEMNPFINYFPKGLDHILSEQGKGLSAGEMQLLSLARAILYQRSVLVLDEASANMDSQTENIMQQALHQALKKQTSLIIAHRLSTIKNVDTIFVIQGGKIIEIGLHSALLEKKGVYEKLYRLQFSSTYSKN